MTDQIQTTDALRNEIVITMDGRDIVLPLDSLSISMESTDSQILDAIRPVMREREGFDIADTRGEFSYSVRKASNSNTIYVYPKPVAGI